jgi:multicomponent Na+:H+ antiporter subunit D
VTETGSAWPALALAPSALAVALIVLSRRHPALRETWSVLAALAQTAAVAHMVPDILAETVPTWRPFLLTPGIPFLLRADQLGVSFALVASALWIVTTVYSIGYTRALGEGEQTRYFACFALCLHATVGLALAGNLLTFFLFFELLTVAAYPLVIHHGTPTARLAGRLYLAYTLTGGSALLAAVVWTHALVGHGDFIPGGILTGAASSTVLALVVLFLVGCGVKAAIIPLHSWLPVAMVAPTPVSALLHAVAVVKAGVFGLLRIVGFVVGPELTRESGGGTILVWLAGATILLGSVLALGQDHLKRLLAFSTISQLSYVVLGAALGTADALAGGVLHMASHAVLKITLFFCAGAIYATAHLERASELVGIGRRMPLTMTAFTVAAFGLAGLPPGAAFASKWLLLQGAADTRAWGAVAVLLASGLLNIAYFAPIVMRAFAPSRPGPMREANPLLLVPLLATAVASSVFGFAPGVLAALAETIGVSVGKP